VRCAVLKMFKGKKLDLIVAGINKGANIGDDVIYSGTVAAAREGALLRIPSISISITAKENVLFNEPKDIIYNIVKNILKIKFPNRVFLNINIPNVKRDEIKGIRITKQGKRIYFHKVIERNKYIKIVEEKKASFILEEDTDVEAIAKNYVSITPLKCDFTDYDNFKKLKNEFLHLKFIC
jgi:5'-nucleotidase